MRLVQISDTHISHRGGGTNENFQKIARFINEQLKPDAVVHSGDIMILDPDNAADRSAAKDLLGLIDAPLYVIPGNHDVGEPGDRPLRRDQHHKRPRPGARRRFRTRPLGRVRRRLRSRPRTHVRAEHPRRCPDHPRPSTAFTAKGAIDLPALEQLGVVEYICEDGTVEAYFRSIPNLIEGEPRNIPEFNAHLADPGITLDA